MVKCCFQFKMKKFKTSESPEGSFEIRNTRFEVQIRDSSFNILVNQSNDGSKNPVS